MPYSIAVKYNRLKPNSSEACKLHLQAKLRDTRIDEGAATEAEVTVVNRSSETVPTPLAIIGVPGGLEVRHDQLKELVKAGKIAAYEVLGREVVLYWRALNAEERVELPLSLVAAIPGRFTGPASRAHLYYTDEHKHWVDGLQAQVVAKPAQPCGLPLKPHQILLWVSRTHRGLDRLPPATPRLPVLLDTIDHERHNRASNPPRKHARPSFFPRHRPWR
jgi:hypothetical protein